MRYSANAYPVAGACPACGSEMSYQVLIYGVRYVTIWHREDDVSVYTKAQLLELEVCQIDRKTKEVRRRNYEFPEPKPQPQ